MRILFIAFMLLSFSSYSQPVRWKRVDTKTKASFRSLSIPDDSVAWVGGTTGTIGRSTDGGKTWIFGQVRDFEKCDFRSLYAFDAANAVIANAGIPAVILRTEDSGAHWKEVYRNDDTSAFFDGIDFWNDKEGLIYGDPINGRMLLLHTNDGGRSWQELPFERHPILEKGEASIAASGTNIRCMDKDRVVIATGGKVSRLLVSDNKGQDWNYIETPILQGENSTGIFSIAFFDKNNGIIAGGDYKKDSLRKDNVFILEHGAKSNRRPHTVTGGYRECVEYINKKTLVAAGPGGTDISYNGGLDWEPIPGLTGLHVVRKSRKGKLVVLAGKEGEIVLLQ